MGCVVVHTACRPRRRLWVAKPNTGESEGENGRRDALLVHRGDRLLWSPTQPRGLDLTAARCGYLIAIFSESYGRLPDGRKMKHYYAVESVGIATGFLIASLHHAGLATLTHTPSPMSFLNEILERPSNERPFLLLVVGYPAADAKVPRIGKKPLAEIATFV